MTDTMTQKLAQAREIQAFRDVVTGFSDPNALVKRAPFAAHLLARIRLLGHLLVQLRFLFSVVGPHEWIVVFDGGRIRPEPGETTYAFVERVGRTNRPQRIPELCGMSPTDRFVLVDVSRSTGKIADAYGTVSFLLALTGVSWLPRLIWDVLQGLRTLGNPKSAVIFATLRMIERRHEWTKCGLLMFTSVTWIAEALRTGLGTAREDLRLVEILHGAGTANTGPYFEWLHTQTCAQITYVNLIADLPRYPPLDAHMMEDRDGEIACNVRLWQTVTEEPLCLASSKSDVHLIAFIGGASHDADYAATVYAVKEQQMIAAIRARCPDPIVYCPHPQHGPAQLSALLGRLQPYGVQVSETATLESMLGASVVVGGLSTSLLEAALLDIPSFAFEDLRAYFIQPTADLVTWSEDFDVLADKLAAALAEAKTKPRSARLQTTASWCEKRYGLEVRLGVIETSEI
ncbi:hypothetical protein KUL25_11825 [Rhodobacteraceae bacterium N5(2021)]|uniref:Uncharacterized protein n=1 Tax=Gymnodinialimonas phycosphaerae TaxID=2841589 RepID=A0A975TSQ0_9RHOB|nr:hypothetical protein [Gymnodinialimonas phycosphaerae]MBY4893453.1 hypothetical protein [Gymnodinialimonas phycosphaerae]